MKPRPVRWCAIGLAVLLAGCSSRAEPAPDHDPAADHVPAPDHNPAGAHDPAERHPAPDAAPLRIVSLDYCADQYVLQFAPRERILAVSPDAAKGFSYLREKARGAPTVRPSAEDVLVLKPDLVVRAYGGGPGAAAFFERAGVPVLEVGYAQDIDGVIATVERMAAGLGASEEGRRLAADMRARLDAVEPASPGARVLYMTPGGATTGPGSLVHELIKAAGLRNYETEPGWRSLPLERLTRDAPDVAASAFFDSMTGNPDIWSAARHPVARAQLSREGGVALDGAWTACGGWFLVEAVEALAAAQPPGGDS